MNKWVEVLLGLILLVGAILLAWSSATYSWTLFGKSLEFWNAAWIFLKGGIFWFVVMIGFLLLILGISDLKD